MLVAGSAIFAPSPARPRPTPSDFLRVARAASYANKPARRIGLTDAVRALRQIE